MAPSRTFAKEALEMCQENLAALCSRPPVARAVQLVAALAAVAAATAAMRTTPAEMETWKRKVASATEKEKGSGGKVKAGVKEEGR